MGQAKAGDFYVNLGVKGDADTKRKLEDQTDAWDKVKSSSTSAKLAILAVLYGVERMVTTYGVAGQQMVNFSTLTGISTQTLQAYENQAMKVGAANGELTQTFDKLQQQMFAVMKGAKPPDWLLTVTGTLQNMGVKFTPEERNNTAQAWGSHPELMFQRMREFSQNKLLDQWKTFNILREMGYSDNMIAGMKQGFFDKGPLAQGANQAISEQNIKNLARMNQEWVNMKLNVEKFFGTLTGEHGLKAVTFISKMTDKLIGLGQAADKAVNRASRKTPEDIESDRIFDLFVHRIGMGIGTVMNARVGSPLPKLEHHTHHVSVKVDNHFAPGAENKAGHIKKETKDAASDIANLYSTKASR